MGVVSVVGERIGPDRLERQAFRLREVEARVGGGRAAQQGRLAVRIGHGQRQHHL